MDPIAASFIHAERADRAASAPRFKSVCERAAEIVGQMHRVDLGAKSRKEPLRFEGATDDLSLG